MSTDRLAELVDAACAWGWDGPPAGTAAPDAARAEALLAAAPELLADFLPACLAGEVAVVGRLLDRDPWLARAKLPPRQWEPLLYLGYDVLFAGARAAGILATAKLLVERGADPNATYTSPAADCGFPALYAAIAVSKNLALARLLLEAGANPNDSQSAYHAAEHDDTAALELLARHGLSHAELSYCLFHKIDFASEAGVRWFVEHGADVNRPHPRAGESKLHWAIKRTCSAATIELLLAHGADPNARTQDGFTAFPRIRALTPLDLSERLGRTEISALLRKHGAARALTTSLDDFVGACARGDRTTARRLLDAEPDLMQRLGDEDRALATHVAQQNNAAGVELMLELGFDANARGWGDLTPLHWAACRGNRPLVRALLARGVSLVDLGGPAGTALHQALYQRWNRDGDYEGVLHELVAAGVPLPETLPPTGDAALDAAVARLRKR